MVARRLPAKAGRPLRLGARPRAPLPCNAPPPVRGASRPCPPRGAAWIRIVTWLILPVVICLSQRLSHACLSISNYTVKLRMAHYISYRLFDSALLLG